jgi:serine/threonine-protein kinase
VSDLRQQLQASLGSAYTIERELGGGGLSRVFVATDVALNRRVVVKVLAPELVHDLSAERFAREIKLAAALQDPHIVPVLSAGNAGELSFYTMPLVVGESLRARLLLAPMPFNEAVDILRDVALALEYAHAHGVVHRDIKPENVLLAGRTAVVADFGIAKAVSAARTHASDVVAATLTSIGQSLGTPAYMAPEQVAGESIDHRADLYAWGVMAYELLAGRHPFANKVSAAQFMAAHLSEQPAPLIEMKPGLPAPVAALVMRCLEKEPANRPQSAADVLHSLDAAKSEGMRAFARPRLRRARIVASLLGVVIVLLGAYFIVHARAGVEVEKRIAVIPFANVGGDAAQQYFAAGISDELTTALGRVSGVRVASRGLTFRYSGQRDLDARAVGRALEVDYLVQGTVRRAVGRLHISAQLTSAKDGSELWADEIERDASDVFAVQDAIAKAITAKLEPLARPATPASKTVSNMQGTSNADAYDLYLRGRYLLDRRGAGVRASISNFEQAIADDPGFGRAYAGLSFAQELMPYFGGVPAPAVRERAWDMAQHALAIDSTLAEAHAGLGLLYEHEYNWTLALAEMRRAVQYAPADAGVRIQLGRTLMYVGDFRAARIQFDSARKLDPYSAVASTWVARALSVAGMLDSSVLELRRAIQLDSSNLLVLGSAQIFAEAGRIEEARALARRTPNVGGELKGYVLGRTGDRAEALAILRDLEAQRQRPWMGEWAIALTAIGVGDTARALSALERSTDAHEIWPLYTSLIDPIYDPLRSSARFAALVRRVGLDERLLTSPRAGRPRPLERAQ